MARYIGAACRLCRREGQKLFLKGERCYSAKCSLERRNYVPGQHGQARGKKPSEYGMQLRAKQKAKRYYGVLESQMEKYYIMATKQPGIAGENLLRLLERRMDNVVYRLGFACSRSEARILVGHGHFTVNGKKMDIPSALLKDDDVIAVAEKSGNSAKFKAIAEINGGRKAPLWLDSDIKTLSGKVVRMPNREDIDLEVEEHLIIEGYSK